MLQEIVQKMLAHPDRKESLRFLNRRTMDGETVFDVLKNSPAKESEVMLRSLRQLRSQLKQPPRVETPLIFTLLKQQRYDALPVIFRTTNPNQIFEGRTPLTYCVAGRDLDGLRALIREPSVDVNRVDGQGRRPLELAVAMNWPEAVKLLLARGADQEAIRCLGHTLVEVAAELEYFEIVELLLQTQVSPS